MLSLRESREVTALRLKFSKVFASTGTVRQGMGKGLHSLFTYGAILLPGALSSVFLWLLHWCSPASGAASTGEIHLVKHVARAAPPGNPGVDPGSCSVAVGHAIFHGAARPFAERGAGNVPGSGPSRRIVRQLPDTPGARVEKRWVERLQACADNDVPLTQESRPEHRTFWGNHGNHS